MQRSRLFLAFAALGLTASALTAQDQYYPAPQRERPVFFLGEAHVDGRVDHDDIHVGRYEGPFHAVLLQVHHAPVLFDHVVIHYGDGYAQSLPVNHFIPAGADWREALKREMTAIF